MAAIKFKTVTPAEGDTIALIAGWYLKEWNIPKQATIERLKIVTADPAQLQVLITLDNLPIATGGLYNHVALLDREPKFKIYKNWLALVYTKPENRNKGYGALICKHIQHHANEMGLKQIFLFTHTAESLYKRLGWQQVERLVAGGKDIVVMKMDL
jgi:GNAT superfamily N-acetyltransferase